MRSMYISALLLIAALCAAARGASGRRYVVLLKDQEGDKGMASYAKHRSWLSSNVDAKQAGIKHFNIPGAQGYAGNFTESMLGKIKALPEVQAVEENQVFSIQVEEGAEWMTDLASGLEKEIGAKEEWRVQENKSKHGGYNSLHNILKGRRHFRRHPVRKVRQYHEEAISSHARVYDNTDDYLETEESRLLEAEGLPGETPLSRLLSYLPGSGRSGRALSTEVLRDSVFKTLHYPTDVTGIEVQTIAPWGLSRLSQRNHVYTLTSYAYPESAGKSVSVYVLDTGVESTHEELHGRVDEGIDIINGTLRPNDDNGHGTHCAGIIAGSKTGVAKSARIVPVKILSSAGKGSTETAILGVAYVMKDHHKRRLRDDHPKTVVNMSLGGLKSHVLNQVIGRAIQMGITFVAAGGNDASDACAYSPASVPEVITVGAIDSRDSIAIFSNTGGCINVYAPGVRISSAYKGNERRILSGTSMASPHVAGLAALYLSEDTEYKSPQEIKILIENDAARLEHIRVASSKILNLRSS